MSTDKLSLPSPQIAPEKLVQSAGAVVYRFFEGEFQVLLVHRPRYRDWSWPKGKLDPNETAAQAAVREVAEETGYQINLQIPLPGIRYSLANGAPKLVHYWAGQLVPDSSFPPLAVRRPVKPAGLNEIDEVRWVPASQALNLLSRRQDSRPLLFLLRHLERNPKLSGLTIIARHAKAEDRSQWNGRDAIRPLSPSGFGQTMVTSQLLAVFGVQHVVSSPWTRCVQSIKHYSDATALAPIFKDSLSEAGYAKAPQTSWETVLAELQSERATVVCTHRPVLKTIMANLKDLVAKPYRDFIPVKDPFLAPGELLVLHTEPKAEKPKIIAVERYIPQIY